MAKLKFRTAFSFPFNRAKGLWNILWILLPIIGWFALGGYGIRIIKGFSAGKFKQLPKFNFSSDLGLGFMMFVKSIPFVIVLIIVFGLLSFVDFWATDILDTLIQFFIIPILFIHFFNKERVGSLFEFKVLKPVFVNLGDYILAVLKDIGLALIFLVMWIVLVGIPAGAFTQSIFVADFYRRRVKKRV
ncbi:DUF4013 domain-containing protein [archaeon]|nr:DUF4013 domain-containing protein [archaeon]